MPFVHTPNVFLIGSEVSPLGAIENLRENAPPRENAYNLVVCSPKVTKLKTQVRQQDAYLAIRPAYPRGCCPRAAKMIKKLHTLLVSLYF